MSDTYVQRIDNRYWCDRSTDRTHALIELVFSLVCADDGPGGPVIDHLLVGFSGTGGGLRKQGVLLADWQKYKTNYGICEEGGILLPSKIKTNVHVRRVVFSYKCTQVSIMNQGLRENKQGS